MRVSQNLNACCTEFEQDNGQVHIVWWGLVLNNHKNKVSRQFFLEYVMFEDRVLCNLYLGSHEINHDFMQSGSPISNPRPYKVPYQNVLFETQKYQAQTSYLYREWISPEFIECCHVMLLKDESSIQSSNYSLPTNTTSRQKIPVGTKSQFSLNTTSIWQSSQPLCSNIGFQFEDRA